MREKMKYMMDEDYRKMKLEQSKKQQKNPDWLLHRKPKLIEGFEPGQFRKWDNPTPELKNIGNLKLSAKEGLWCPYCGALYFADEVNGLGQYTQCCMNGTMKNHLLIDETVPDEFLALYCPKTKREKKLSKLFKQNIIKINNIFAMTSFGGKKNIMWSTVKIHGKCFHRLDYLVPTNKDTAAFAQLYFLNDGDQLEKRLQMWKQMLVRASDVNNDEERKKLERKIKRHEKKRAEIKELVSIIQNVLNKQNKFVQRYKTAKEMMNQNDSANLKIVFKCNQRPRGTHARLYNKPIEDEIGVLVPDTDKTKYASRCIVMYLKDSPNRFKDKKKPDAAYNNDNDEFNNGSRKRYQRINEFNKQYDPLHYVVLFPAGKMSWGFYLPRETSIQTEKKYCPPTPRYDHRCDSEDRLQQLCSSYGLLVQAPREMKIKQIEQYETYQRKVTKIIFYPK